MALTEEKVLEGLSKSERTVYDYLKAESMINDGSIKKSMKEIGNELGLSEATVHRAVRKLRKQGVIGIIPSMEKAESNEIIYYGIPDPDEQVSDIFKMIGELSSNANRFEAILSSKDQEIAKLQREKELLYQEIDSLKQELRTCQLEKSGIDLSKIISTQPLDDTTTAYIIKNE